MGSSSGGLTVLGMLATHGHLAAGGVTLYPVADLAALAAATHRFEAHYTLSLVGPPEHVDVYTSRSPVAHADRISSPLLILHGDQDPVVPLSSSSELAARIREAGGDVELIVLEGEGHGFRDAANQHLEYAVVERFVTELIGGEGPTGVDG